MNLPKIVRLTFALVPLTAAGIVAGEEGGAAVNAPQAALQPQYRVIDLGEDAFGNGITASGRIVGSTSFGGAPRRAAFWPSPYSPPIDLGTLPGFVGSRGLGVNVGGEIVGVAVPFSSARPLYWADSQSAPMQLPGLPVGLRGWASSINQVGQIVGTFFSAGSAVQRAVFWANSNTPAIYLVQLSDALPLSVAVSINPSGSILGDTCDADFVECHAVFWASSAGAPVALASPGEEFIYTDVGLESFGEVAPALNNAGSMVGYAYKADFSETRAVFWLSSTSSAVILSTTGEFPNAGAEGINDKGQIVGIAYDGGFTVSHAFIWQNSNSPGVDLNTLIPSDSGWELSFARSVNNRGEITGHGLLNGVGHGYVLIPVRAPLRAQPFRH